MEALNAWATVASAAILGVTLPLVIAAAWLAYGQVSSIEKTRRTQLAWDVAKRWDEALIAGAQAARNYKTQELTPERLAEKLLELETENPLDYYNLTRVAKFFQDLGSLESQGMIPPFLAATYRRAAKDYWGRWGKELASKLQDKYKGPIYKDFGEFAEGGEAGTAE